jgi:hypothetical protein
MSYTNTKEEDYLTNVDKQASVMKYQLQLDQMAYQPFLLSPEEIGNLKGGENE